MIKSDGTIVVFEPNGIELTIESFVKKYSKAYCLGEEKIPSICYRQSNDEAEREILRGDFTEYCKFAQKMAWKTGRVRYSKDINSHMFTYTSDWSNCEIGNPRRYGEEIDLKLYHKRLCEIQKKEIIKTQDIKKQFVIIYENRVKGIGIVYSIASLFFLTEGRYPIFDCFTNNALEAVFSHEPLLPLIGKHIKRDYSKYDDVCYETFIGRMQILMKRLKISCANYIEYRDLDRALWVYGHGFRNSQGNTGT